MSKQSSPRLLARGAGALYLAVIIGGIFAEALVRQRLIVGGDAAATAANILANEQLYRWGFAADLVPVMCNMGLAAIFYALFKPVSRNAAMLVVCFTLVGSAIQGAALLFHLGPLLVLKNVAAFAALDEAQRQGLAYLSVRFQAQGYTTALVFFGGFGVSIGYLILRSAFLPKFLGVLMVISGLCYFSNSMLVFVAPQWASVLFLLPCLVAEASLTLWLLFAGVDEPRWRAQAATPAPA